MLVIPALSGWRQDNQRFKESVQHKMDETEEGNGKIFKKLQISKNSMCTLSQI